MTHRQLVIRDVVMLVARLVLGFILLARGWYRLANAGVGTYVERLPEWLSQYATILYWGSISVEIFGGLALICGLATRFVALLLLIQQLLIVLLVRASYGVYVQDGGFEYNLSLATLAFVVLMFGPGRISIDNYLFRGHGHDRRADEEAVEDELPAHELPADEPQPSELEKVGIASPTSHDSVGTTTEPIPVVTDTTEPTPAPQHDEAPAAAMAAMTTKAPTDVSDETDSGSNELATPYVTDDEDHSVRTSVPASVFRSEYPSSADEQSDESRSIHGVNDLGHSSSSPERAAPEAHIGGIDGHENNPAAEAASPTASATWVGASTEHEAQRRASVASGPAVDARPDTAQSRPSPSYPHIEAEAAVRTSDAQTEHTAAAVDRSHTNGQVAHPTPVHSRPISVHRAKSSPTPSPSVRPAERAYEPAHASGSLDVSSGETTPTTSDENSQASTHLFDELDTRDYEPSRGVTTNEPSAPDLMVPPVTTYMPDPVHNSMDSSPLIFTPHATPAIQSAATYEPEAIDEPASTYIPEPIEEQPHTYTPEQVSPSKTVHADVTPTREYLDAPRRTVEEYSPPLEKVAEPSHSM